MTSIHLSGLAVGLMLLFASSFAAAGVPGATAQGGPPIIASGGQASTSFQDQAPAIDPQALDGYRGGADTVTNTVGIGGEVSNNNAHDIVTGDNVIDGGAFADSAGISTVIQNSGANVLIQNGTVVNVQFTDPGVP